MKKVKEVEKRANLAAQATYYREISKLFLVLAKVTEKAAKKTK